MFLIRTNTYTDRSMANQWAGWLAALLAAPLTAPGRPGLVVRLRAGGEVALSVGGVLAGQRRHGIHGGVGRSHGHLQMGSLKTIAILDHAFGILHCEYKYSILPIIQIIII